MAPHQSAPHRVRRFALSEVAAAAAASRGTRFTTRYERRSHLRRLHPSRIIRIGIALGLFAFGIANVFIPGPGGSIFIFSSALVLSGESRRFAAFLDRSELKLDRQVDWMLRHPILVGTSISATVIVVMFLLARAFA